MNKFEILENSPEKTAFVELTRKYLPNVKDFLHGNFAALADMSFDEELSFRGHHIKHPLLTFLHDNPDIRSILNSDALDIRNINVIQNPIVNATDKFIVGILESDRSLAYIQDVIGANQEELLEFYRRFAKIYISLITGPENLPVLLTANTTKDEMCNSCSSGKHCLMVGDEFSKVIDAIFVDQLVENVAEGVNILQKEILWDRKEYVTEAKMPLGLFRQGLLYLYPQKRHLFDESLFDELYGES